MNIMNVYKQSFYTNNVTEVEAWLKENEYRELTKYALEDERFYASKYGNICSVKSASGVYIVKELVKNVSLACEKPWALKNVRVGNTVTYVHRLIAEAWLEKNDDCYDLVEFKNGDRRDCSADNLAYRVKRS